MTQAKHPIQPLALDEHGVMRFKRNAIVIQLLDHSTINGYSMNNIALGNFTKEDRQQFAQLIGYSLGGYGDLTNYVDNNAYNVAELLANNPTMTEDRARVEVLEERLREMNKAVDAMRCHVAILLEMHPDDLNQDF